MQPISDDIKSYADDIEQGRIQDSLYEGVPIRATSDSSHLYQLKISICICIKNSAERFFCTIELNPSNQASCLSTVQNSVLFKAM